MSTLEENTGNAVFSIVMYAFTQAFEAFDIISPPIVFASFFMIFLNNVIGYLTAETIWGAHTLFAIENSAITVVSAFGLYCSIGSPYDKSVVAAIWPTWEAMFLGSMIWASTANVVESPEALVDYTIEGAILVASEGMLNEQEELTSYTLLVKQNVRIFSVYFVFLTYLSKVLLQIIGVIRVIELVVRELDDMGAFGRFGNFFCNTEDDDDDDDAMERKSERESLVRKVNKDALKHRGKGTIDLMGGNKIDIYTKDGDVVEVDDELLRFLQEMRDLKIKQHPSIVNSIVAFVKGIIDVFRCGSRSDDDEGDSKKKSSKKPLGKRGGKEEIRIQLDIDDDDITIWNYIHHGANLFIGAIWGILIVMYIVIDEVGIEARIASAIDLLPDTLDALLGNTDGMNVTSDPSRGSWAAALAVASPYIAYIGTLALLLPVPFVHDLRASGPLFTVGLFQMILAMDRGGREDVWFDVALVLLGISVAQILVAPSVYIARLIKPYLQILFGRNDIDEEEERAESGGKDVEDNDDEEPELVDLASLRPLANILYKSGLILCILSLALVLVSVNFDWMRMDFEPSAALNETGNRIREAQNSMEEATASLSKMITKLDPCYQEFAKGPVDTGTGTPLAVTEADIERQARDQRAAMYNNGPDEVKECFDDDAPQNDYEFGNGGDDFCDDIRDGFDEAMETAKNGISNSGFDVQNSVADKSPQELMEGEINWSCRKTICDVVLVMGVAGAAVSWIPFCGPIGFGIKLGSEAVKGTIDIGLNMFRALKALYRRKIFIARLASLIFRLIKKTKKLIRMLAWLNILFVPLLITGTIALMLAMTRRDLSPADVLNKAIERTLKNKKPAAATAEGEKSFSSMDRLRVGLKLSLGVWVPILIANTLLMAGLIYWPIAMNTIIGSLPKHLVSGSMQVRVGLVALQLAYMLSTVGSLMVTVSAVLIGADTAIFALVRVPFRWAKRLLKWISAGIQDAFSSDTPIEETTVETSVSFGFGESTPALRLFGKNARNSGSKRLGNRETSKISGRKKSGTKPTPRRRADKKNASDGDDDGIDDDDEVEVTCPQCCSSINFSLKNLNNFWIHAMLLNIPVVLMLFDLAIYRDDAKYLHFGYTGNDELKASREDYAETRSASEGTVSLKESMEDSLCGLVAMALEAILKSTLDEATGALAKFAEALSSAVSEAANFFDVFNYDFAVNFIRLDYELFPSSAAETIFALALPILNVGIIVFMYVFSLLWGDTSVSGMAASIILQLASTNFLVHIMFGAIFGLIETADMPFIAMRIVLGDKYYISLMASVFHAVSALSVYVNLLIRVN